MEFRFLRANNRIAIGERMVTVFGQFRLLSIIPFMKFRIILFAALLAVPVTVGLCADEPKGPSQEETELEGKMDKMNGAFRKLKRQVSDPTKNADSLQLVARMRAAAEDAVKLNPAKATDLPEDERAKFVAEYQLKMKDFIVELGKLEAALNANKNDEAVKLVADLGARQKAGHKDFKRPDKEK
jgi:soluble cytochrome b562